MSFTNTFLVEANRMQGTIAKRGRIISPFSTVMKKAEWPKEYGHVLTSVIQERTIPGDGIEADGPDQDDGGWTAINASNAGTCLPGEDTIPHKTSSATWQLYTKAFNSDGICMDDLRAAYEIADQAAGVMDNFEKNIIDILTERDRQVYTLLSAHKVVATADFDEDDAAFPELEPVYTLNQAILSKYRKKLIRDGAGENGAYAKANGAPVFLVFMSSEAQENLFMQDANLRQDLRWAKPGQLLEPYGIDRSYGGFFHMIDDKMPRWNFTGGHWVRVPFYVMSSGKAVVNPDYEDAEFEDAIIWHPDVTTRHVPASFVGAGDIRFTPQDYYGKIRFLNIPHATTNPDGTNGFFRCTIQVGYKPNLVDYGTVIRFKRCPNIGFMGCDFVASS